MSRPERDPGRGQLRKRSARAWRDEANPTGPGVVSDEAELEDAEADAAQAPDHSKADPDEPVNAAEPVNAGPGGGGATESAPGDRQHEGQHGGPSDKA